MARTLSFGLVLLSALFGSSTALANDEDKAACVGLEEGDPCQRSDESAGVCRPDDSDPDVLSCEDYAGGDGDGDGGDGDDDGGENDDDFDNDGCSVTGAATSQALAFATLGLMLGLGLLRPLAGGRGGAAADGYISLEEPAKPEPSASGSFTGTMKRTGLSGRLEQLELSSLLVMIEMERKDGVLQIQHGEDKRVGRIFFRRGQVIQSRIDEDNVQRDGQRCVSEMLCWQKGRFHFSVMDVDMEDLVHTSTTSLLLEGARLIDEANR